MSGLYRLYIRDFTAVRYENSNRMPKLTSAKLDSNRSDRSDNLTARVTRAIYRLRFYVDLFTHIS